MKTFYLLNNDSILNITACTKKCSMFDWQCIILGSMLPLVGSTTFTLLLGLLKQKIMAMHGPLVTVVPHFHLLCFTVSEKLTTLRQFCQYCKTDATIISLYSNRIMSSVSRCAVGGPVSSRLLYLRPLPLQPQTSTGCPRRMERRNVSECPPCRDQLY